MFQDIGAGKQELSHLNRSKIKCKWLKLNVNGKIKCRYIILMV